MQIKTEDRHLADAVLAIIKTYDIDCNIELSVHEYDNGREHGYVLELDSLDNYFVSYQDSLWVAFSENRNSDDIVIYMDKGHYVGKLTDSSYNSRVYYGYGQIVDAATYITNCFESHVKLLKEKVGV